VLRRFLHPSHGQDVKDAVPLLTYARVAANTAYRFAPPFVAVIARSLGVPLTSMGDAMSVGEFTGLLAPLVGKGVERRSRRGAMTVGLLGVVSGAALAAGSNLVLLAIAFAWISLTKMVFDTSLSAWIGERVAYERRSEVVGLTETSWAGAMLIGVPILGLITAASSWRVAYMAIAIVTLGFALALHRKLPPGVAVVHDEERAKVRFTRASLSGYAGFAFLMTGANAIFITFGAWLGDDFGFSSTAIAVTAVLLGVSELVASASTVRLTDRLGKRRAVVLGTAIMAPAALALSIVGHRTALGLLVLALFIGGFEFAIVSSIPLVTDLQPDARAAALGLAVGGGTLGRGVMALVAPRLYTAHGIGGSAALSAGCGVAAMLLFGMGTRSLDASRPLVQPRPR
jgi:DHA1 family inner membrane transport protein